MKDLLDNYEYQLPVSNGKMRQDKDLNSDSGTYGNILKTVCILEISGQEPVHIPGEY